MLTFGSTHPRIPIVRTASEEARITVPSSSATPQQRNRHIGMTDQAALAMAELRISNPAAYEAEQQRLSTLTKQGDDILLSKHGPNASQLRNLKAQQGSSNQHSNKSQNYTTEIKATLANIPEQYRKMALQIVNNNQLTDAQVKGLEKLPPDEVKRQMSERTDKLVPSIHSEIAASSTQVASLEAPKKEKTEAQKVRNAAKKKRQREKAKPKKAELKATEEITTSSTKSSPFHSNVSTPTKSRSRASSPSLQRRPSLPEKS